MMWGTGGAGATGEEGGWGPAVGTGRGWDAVGDRRAGPHGDREGWGHAGDREGCGPRVGDREGLGP